MRFLLDVASHKVMSTMDCYPSLVSGQLLTPLTHYRLGDVPFAIDNGGFSRLDVNGFRRLVESCRDHRDRCLFVAMPDVVGNARRTLELFTWFNLGVPMPRALVIQDGIGELEIPWGLLDAVFIGGTTTFKCSQEVEDVIIAARALGKHVHAGRVNTIKRFRWFDDRGVDTCDGSGVCRFDWMLKAIASGQNDDMPLFDYSRAGS